ncbi:MAG: multicopper oxidase domain-containing protein, partial [Gemmatimonadales bacterium]
MRHLTVSMYLLAVLVACHERPPEADQQPETPPTAAPADLSHGEAPVGSTEQPSPIDPAAPPRSNRRLHRLRIEINHKKLTIAAGVTYDAWTFDGRVPGPALRVTEGDTVDFTLVNRAPMPHSLDFHAAEIAPNRAYRNLMPNDSLSYRFVARVPGAFMYHCGTAPVALHIANGMYGAIIVDPAQGRSPAREF